MKLTTLRKMLAAAALAAAFVMFLTPPCSAQVYGRGGGGAVTVGEPTDPDGVLPSVEQAGVDLADYGLETQAPTNETEAQTWFERVVELLRSLGLLPSTGND